MSKEKTLRTNEEIKAPQVRLIDESGTQLGIMPVERALQLARQKGLDLVEVAMQSQPPVCKILNYDQYRYAQRKKTKEQRKKQKASVCKEIRFRPGTATHDFDSKVRRVQAFLKEGNKVRIRLTFRGRELSHPQLGERLLQKIIDVCKDIAQVEIWPKQEENQMVLMLGPRSHR